MQIKTLSICRSIISVAAALLLSVASVVRAEETDSSAKPSQKQTYDWAVTGYVARLSRDRLGDMVTFDAELEDNRLYALALTRRLGTFWRDVDWELEGQIAKHAGSSTPSWAGGHEVSQDHWEFNILTSIRWNRFFWDKYLDTSFATGLGFSYESELPEFEFYGQCYQEINPDRPKCSSNRLMAYILVELAFSLPQYPQWAVVSRIHHRSSAYGIFEEDIEGASNSLGVGLKYRF